jgi:F420-0:gamma-glutamyl ligase
MTRQVSVLGLETIGVVKPGDDVGQIIFDAAKQGSLAFAEDDVVVVSQKIVSKAEGREFNISTIKPSRRAKALSRRTGKDARLVELILRDTKRILRADREALVTERKDGMVCVNGVSVMRRFPGIQTSQLRRLGLGLRNYPGQGLLSLSRILTVAHFESAKLNLP